ncbi:MAG: response regulator transcription factor [Actinomycetota bacterium]|nr:response regulator transcription factor [Actinomycetota bacterium]
MLPRRIGALVDERNAALAGLRVLVVEDDAAIRGQLVKGLNRVGCRATGACGGTAALQTADAGLVLLDLGLPDIDGVEVCRQLRARGGPPIIVVTARQAVPDRVAALDAGADDYIIKPFGFDELLARMRAVLRRAATGGTGRLGCGRIGVDVAGRRAYVDGQEVILTGKEFDILACLALEPGRVVSREEIFDRVWDEHWYGPRKVLDVHMAALRRKLGAADLVETVYGRGFRLSGR